MPTFIKSTKDNKKLYGKTASCLKIYLKLIVRGASPPTSPCQKKKGKPVGFPLLAFQLRQNL
ncbi:hypothetical protein CN393_07925 [Bacillus cereus]|nr:hypothetical protein CN393_07925 [Bacillus cereus]